MIYKENSNFCFNSRTKTLLRLFTNAAVFSEFIILKYSVVFLESTIWKLRNTNCKIIPFKYFFVEKMGLIRERERESREQRAESRDGSYERFMIYILFVKQSSVDTIDSSNKAYFSVSLFNFVIYMSV